MKTQGKREGRKMVDGGKLCNATKTSIDGIKFDSKFEADIYEILRGKIRRINNPHLRIVVHYPIHFTGGKIPVRVSQKPTWKVDFVVIDASKDNALICAIEAKGRFFDQDKYKFVLWDLYQTIPLIVVYQKKKPLTLLSNGWLTFLPTFAFKSLDLVNQVRYKKKANEPRS